MKSQPIAPDVAELGITGRNLPAATLGEALDAGTTLLVFLRHLG